MKKCISERENNLQYDWDWSDAINFVLIKRTGVASWSKLLLMESAGIKRTKRKIEDIKWKLSLEFLSFFFFWKKSFFISFDKNQRQKH
jgi:hypothetical protein